RLEHHTGRLFNGQTIAYVEGQLFPDLFPCSLHRRFVHRLRIKVVHRENSLDWCQGRVYRDGHDVINRQIVHGASPFLTVSISSSIIRLHIRNADVLPRTTPILYALKMQATNTSTRRSSSVMRSHPSPPDCLFAHSARH